MAFQNTEMSKAGPYSVVVTNSAGSVTSLSALLTVNSLQGGITNPVVEEPIVEAVSYTHLTLPTKA